MKKLVLLRSLGFCTKTAKVWQTIGYAVFVVKIVVPLLIIILGIIDLAKAIISNDDKTISKSAISILKRLILGIAIFFVPTLINYAFKVISKFSDARPDYVTCFDCLTKPNECDVDTGNENNIFNY